MPPLPPGDSPAVANPTDLGLLWTVLALRSQASPPAIGLWPDPTDAIDAVSVRLRHVRRQRQPASPTLRLACRWIDLHAWASLALSDPHRQRQELARLDRLAGLPTEAFFRGPPPAP